MYFPKDIFSTLIAEKVLFSKNKSFFVNGIKSWDIFTDKLWRNVHRVYYLLYTRLVYPVNNLKLYFIKKRNETRNVK